MRRLSSAVSAVALCLGLALALALVGASPASAQGLARYKHVPVQVFSGLYFNSVAVGMPDARTVKIQHFSASLHGWDAPTTLYKAPHGVTCGAISGRVSGAAGGQGIALIIACDKPYADDQAPTHSVALVSRDGVSWAHKRLKGEAFLTPAVSTSGAYAAWLAGGTGEYVEWSAATGFAAPAHTTYSFDSGGETVVADDTGTVTVIGPEETGSGDCTVGVHSRDLAGVTGSATVAGIDPGCTEGQLEDVDSLSVTGGDTPATTFTIGRTSVGAPWLLTRIRPVDAPGLVNHAVIHDHFVSSEFTNDPIDSVGSPDGHTIYAQPYDAGSQSWGPAVPVADTVVTCHDTGYDPDQPRALYVVELRCGDTTRVLTSFDGTAWTNSYIGKRPWTFSYNEAAFPGPTVTTIVSGLGTRLIPATGNGQCDVVFPANATQLLRLHGVHWPNKLQQFNGTSWQTLSKTHLPHGSSCQKVRVDNTTLPSVITLRGAGHSVQLAFQYNASTSTWKVKHVHQ